MWHSDPRWSSVAVHAALTDTQDEAVGRVIMQLLG